MKSKPDLALDSSSIGGRVRSKKQKAGVGPSESMDISGSSLDLTAEGVPSTDSSLGKRTTERVLKLPIERRQVPFLVSREALERCSIWGSKGEEALAEYKRAFEVISAKMIAPKRAAPSENDDEVFPLTPVSLPEDSLAAI
ncbi:hypothetical protein HID58_079897 [Brassica napus]|uniref:Uncharacterized protein n=1 Tax=Brassica napus TaxID=3708 RepID=A0ABQ7Y3E5_BRANA|nr:hypothetical protein HID58_079897 [Brassica napus]